MKLVKLILIVLVPLSTTSCLGSSEAFWHESAQLTCRALQECNKSLFESQYSSMTDCIDTVAENGIDNTSTCEYDPEKGHECISAGKKYKHECDPNAAQLQEIADA